MTERKNHDVTQSRETQLLKKSMPELVQMIIDLENASRVKELEGEVQTLLMQVGDLRRRYEQVQAAHINYVLSQTANVQ